MCSGHVYRGVTVLLLKAMLYKTCTPTYKHTSTCCTFAATYFTCISVSNRSTEHVNCDHCKLCKTNVSIQHKTADRHMTTMKHSMWFVCVYHFPHLTARNTGHCKALTAPWLSRGFEISYRRTADARYRTMYRTRFRDTSSPFEMIP